MSYDNNFSHYHDEFGEIICSKAVRAGKRTYFFDVKATQGDLAPLSRYSACSTDATRL